jgi:Big-like domain-containing protein/Calx-beta domain-containing protein
MSRPVRSTELVAIFRLGFSHRLLLITAALMLGLTGVVITKSFALRASSGSSAAPVLVSGQESNSVLHSKKSIDLLEFAGLRHRTAPLSLSSPLAPTVTASKADSLFTDVDGDLQADPGDTLKYTVNISASGEDATGVTFTDTVDPNTAFVAGTLRATPVAVDDTYAATGNIRISVAAPGVLGNDFAGVPSATITAPPVTSTNGGDVTLNADGSFTYNPPAGFEGADTFTYTLTNSEGSNSATVTINVSGMIWFINNSASCPCDGRLTNPFNSLASFQAVNDGVGNHPAANDNIFVYESATDYVGPVTLLNGQRFLGQDATASLSAMTGLTPPAGSDPLPATDSGNATIVNITTGNAITVGSGNTLRGFTGGNSTTDISGTGFGTLNISDVTLNGTGQALDLTTGTLAATFGAISSTNSATTGISLTSVAGTLTTPTTTVTNPAGIGISVDTSSATLNFGTTSSTGSGGTGVSLLTNTGTITFGTLDITPDANQRALLATDNSNTITSTGGAVTTSGATAVEITRASGTTPLVMVLTSINAGGATNGIKLTNTSGSFTVTGAGSANSGGAISNSSGDAVLLNNVTNFGLIDMTISTSAQSHMDGTSVNGLSLTRVSTDLSTDHGFLLNTVTNLTINGGTFDRGGLNNTACNFDGFHVTNLFGTSSITGATFKRSNTRQFFLLNNAATSFGGTPDQLTVNNTQWNTHNVNLIPNNTPCFGDHLSVSSDTGGNFRLIVNNTGGANVFKTGGIAVQAAGAGSGKLDAQVSGVTSGGTIASGDMNTAGVVVAATGASIVSFDVFNNTTLGTGSSALVVRHFTNASIMGKVRSNSVIHLAGPGTDAVSIINQGTGSNASPGSSISGNGTGTISISSNNVSGDFQRGIYAQSAFSNGVLNLTINNNTVIGTSASALQGIFVETGGSGQGSGNDICLNEFSNNVTMAGGSAYRLVSRGATNCTIAGGCTFSLEGFVPTGSCPTASGSSTADVMCYITNTKSNVGSPIAVTATQPYVNSAGCAMPALMANLGDSALIESYDTLAADIGEGPSGDYVQRLRDAELSWTVLSAIERWRQAGSSPEHLIRLQSMTFEIADLPDGQLATATSTHVRIDETAAGYGWFADPAPMEDSEFDVPVPGRELQTTEQGPAFRRMDLLTVVMHELGLAYGQGKKGLPKQMQSLMLNTLSPGVRRLPDSRNIQLSTTKGRKLAANQPVRKEGVSPAANPYALLRKPAIPAPVSFTKAGFNPIAKNASRQSNRLHHSPLNRAPVASPSTMLADVLLSIGTLPAGESVTITFNVTVDDPFTGALPQVSNQGTVSGSNFADVLTDDPAVGGAADPTVTPIDLPQVSVAVSPTSVLEDGGTNLVYTFTRTGSTANAMTVNFSVGGTASFTEPDYTQTGAATFSASSGTVVIPSGSSTATVTVDPSVDLTVEPDETVDLTVTSGTGYTVGVPSTASGTITNDDTSVSVAVAPGSVAEDGASNLVYTFTRNGVTTGALTVNFSIGGTANFGASPNDYTQTGAASFTPPTGTVTFGAGNSTATVTVDPESDTTVESDETVILTVTSGTGYTVGAPSTATGTITNDDADVSVSVSPASVAEDGATNLVYTFTRTGFTANAVTVNFSVGGTASFTEPDYSQTGAATFTATSGTVNFGAGSSTASVTIDPTTDSTPEPDETVVLTVTSGTGYNVGSPSSASGTIVNDDTVVTLAVSPLSTAEGGSNLVYTFTRTGSTAGSLTVNFSVAGSAGFGSDYNQTGATTFTPSSGTVTFGAGNSTAAVNVTPLTDCAIEGPETVQFTVTAGAGYLVGSPSSATGTITNTPDPTPPVISGVSASPSTLSPPNHQMEDVTINYSATDNCGSASCVISNITSNQPINGTGDGDTAPDWEFVDEHHVRLRSERSNGVTRVYTITITCTDAVGNISTTQVQVTVP